MQECKGVRCGECDGDSTCSPGHLHRQALLNVSRGDHVFSNACVVIVFKAAANSRNDVGSCQRTSTCLTCLNASELLCLLLCEVACLTNSIPHLFYQPHRCASNPPTKNFFLLLPHTFAPSAPPSPSPPSAQAQTFPFAKHVQCSGSWRVRGQEARFSSSLPLPPAPDHHHSTLVTMDPVSTLCPHVCITRQIHISSRASAHSSSLKAAIPPATAPAMLT